MELFSGSEVAAMASECSTAFGSCAPPTVAISPDGGQFTNSTVVTFGTAATIDGNHDAVVIGNPPALQLPTFTIDAWVKRARTDFGSNATFVASATGTAPLS